MRAPAGGTLEDRLRDGPLAPAQAVSVVARLADALAALHEKKCLHGAVKPSIRPSLRVIGVRLQDVASRGSRDRQPHRAVQLHAVSPKNDDRLELQYGGAFGVPRTERMGACPQERYEHPGGRARCRPIRAES